MSELKSKYNKFFKVAYTPITHDTFCSICNSDIQQYKEVNKCKYCSIVQCISCSLQSRTSNWICNNCVVVQSLTFQSFPICNICGDTVEPLNPPILCSICSGLNHRTCIIKYYPNLS